MVAVRVSGGDCFESSLEPSVGFGATKLCDFDELDDLSPFCGTFVANREHRFHSCRGNWPCEIFHTAVIPLDPPISEVDQEAVHETGDLGEVLAKGVFLDERPHCSFGYSPRASTNFMVLLTGADDPREKCNGRCSPVYQYHECL